ARGDARGGDRDARTSAPGSDAAHRRRDRLSRLGRTRSSAARDTRGPGAARGPRDHSRRSTGRDADRHQGRLERTARAPGRADRRKSVMTTALDVAPERVVTLEYTVHLENGTLVDSTG